MAEIPTGGPADPQPSAPAAQTADPAAVKLLRSLLNDNITGFRASAARNRHRAVFFKIAAASLSAMTTLLLGLKSSPVFAECEHQLSAFALVFSAIVPILVAWDSFFDHRWQWVRFTSAHNSLFKLQDDLAYAEANKVLTPKALDVLYEQFRNAVDQTSNAWIEKKERPSSGEQQPGR